MTRYDYRLEDDTAESTRDERIAERVLELTAERITDHKHVQDAIESMQADDYEQFVAGHLTTFFLACESAPSDKDLAEAALRLAALLRPGIKETLTDGAKTDATTEYDNQQRDSADMRDERRAA